jgi:FixJ family two-component response regulator
MSNKVLFVDDEQNILDTFRRLFHNDLEMKFCNSGARALSTIRESGPFAVIVSDQHMPEMDGTQFLAEARKLDPDCVRVMLTGNADLSVAISAVNDGRIFRFLCKPVEPNILLITIKACIAQHNLIISERELLEQTLSGALEVMSETLSLVNPLAFSQTLRVRRCIRLMANSLGLPGVWEYEMAALVSQIGCVTLPSETLQKVHRGASLTPQEHESYRAHPEVAAKLLSKIPRLETVTEMVRLQQRSFKIGVNDSDLSKQERGAIGGHLLRIAIAFDQRRMRGMSVAEAIAELESDKVSFHQALVQPLRGLEAELWEENGRELEIRNLEPGQVLSEDVYSSNGILLAAAGMELTETMLLRLRAFNLANELKRSVCVIKSKLEASPSISRSDKPSFAERTPHESS